MTIDEIKELIRVVQDTGIAELEVRQGDSSVRIRSAASPGHQELVVPTVLPISVAAAPAPSPPAPPPPAPAPDALPPPPTTAAKEAENDVVVKSPIVGTYYDAPVPGSPPFVKVGDKVKPKQVLCIIESMKLMNEIEAEFAGEIIAKHVENSRPVEYGESLFTIRPA
ncbi:MAG TPA: acetyl-CoA carboxylase biotin carboxyl carrier protein [Bryobacteraceae bacterium]|nr:acetyl-CoA carboxylase biotin carboxyl carrier protein [Bryobacteraceae bacterium]